MRLFVTIVIRDKVTSLIITKIHGRMGGESCVNEKF